MKARDPKIDPQPGDIVRKGTGSGVVVRTVFKRDGSNIYYRFVENGRERLCWITTWQTWCRDATVVNTTTIQAPKEMLAHAIKLEELDTCAGPLAMPSRTEPLSACCQAPCTIVGKTTLHYECTKCKQACDAKT